MTNPERLNASSRNRRRITITISRCGATAIVAVGGCVVSGPQSAGFLLEALARCSCRDTDAIIVDLRDVELMDAAGIGVLASVYGDLRQAGMRFAVVNPSQFLREVFRIAGLDGLLLSGIEPAEDAA